MAGGAHERHRLGEQHAHRVAHRERLPVDGALELQLRERRGGQLDGGVQGQRRELLALRLLHRLGLLLGEFAQAAQEILGVAAEREASESTFHPSKLAQVDEVAALDLAANASTAPVPARSASENGERQLAERPFERSVAAPTSSRYAGVASRGGAADGLFERERGSLRLLDPWRLFDHPHLDELRAQLLQVAPPASSADSSHIATIDAASRTSSRRATTALGVVEHEPTPLLARIERNQVATLAVAGSAASTPATSPHAAAAPAIRARSSAQRHRVQAYGRDRAVRAARPGLRPLGGDALVRTGSPMAAIPRLADRCRPARHGARRRDRYGAVAIELVRQKDCFVVGIDLTSGMLDEARRRVVLAAASEQIRLQEGDARSLPFEDGQFDALTFTYLLRYVDDPPAVLRELARVVKPGGTIAGLEFGVPSGLWRPSWELWTRVGLPVAGRLIGDGWHEVGSFLNPSIREFYDRWPLPRLAAAWGEAGIDDVQTRRLSLGGGVVTWGRRKA